jgi:hypothetical protein
MALHHLTKKAAIEKYSPLLTEGKTREAIALELARDPKDFSEEDINEIMNAIIGETQNDQRPKSQSESLGLDRFDYKKEEGFVGAQFKEYEAMILKFPLTKQYDFEVYRVKPVRVERYPGLPQSPIDTIGIRIESDRPLMTTRVEARHALEMNRQLQNTGRYFLLKK